ncbi:hypothetical protein BDW42DRAFT_93281 [Aspergillus taichungensis]|uniref:Uncharacterized protein n=1 Tax=Aspergillus taichungensis TaxID=482145 RepID=A0A2J5I8H0_9EURO|nr:hypothetical protein BDW42DRAFT_93281 [Aspergillus taichungensis]
MTAKLSASLRWSSPQYVRPLRWLRHASSSTLTRSSSLRVTQSQLLQFALTGSKPPIEDDRAGLNRDLCFNELFLEEWPLPTNSNPSLGSVIQEKTEAAEDGDMPGDPKGDAQLLQNLRSYIEKNVQNGRQCALLQDDECKPLMRALSLCQEHHSYGEILMFINAAIHRIEVLRAPVSEDLRFLGMYYACLAFSAPALQHHLDNFGRSCSRHLTLEKSVILVRALDTTLQVLAFQRPDFDAGAMLSVVAGESGPAPPPRRTLHGILYWDSLENGSEDIGLYLTLLARLRSDSLLCRIWKQTLDKMTASSFPAFESTYGFVKTFVDTGKPQDAVTYLRQISKRSNDTLPNISRFPGLSGLLADGEVSQTLPELAGPEEYLRMLETQTGDMESRLGIRWQPEMSHHTDISDPSTSFTNQPLLTIDGESSGYESAQRLIAEIHTFGCSKSTADLGSIANLLDEHDGESIPVCVSREEGHPLEFCWFPQRSPVEWFSPSFPLSTDMSRPWSPLTLGLVRARLSSSGPPLAKERFLYLMQLGYLAARPKKAPPGDRPPWKESGHIVAWDRVSGQFLMIYPDKGCRTVPTSQLLEASPPQSSLVTIRVIYPMVNGLRENKWMVKSLGQIRKSRIKCQFEADPGLDLVA